MLSIPGERSFIEWSVNYSESYLSLVSRVKTPFHPLEKLLSHPFERCLERSLRLKTIVRFWKCRVKPMSDKLSDVPVAWNQNNQHVKKL